MRVVLLVVELVVIPHTLTAAARQRIAFASEPGMSFRLPTMFAELHTARNACVSNEKRERLRLCRESKPFA